MDNSVAVACGIGGGMGGEQGGGGNQENYNTITIKNDLKKEHVEKWVWLRRQLGFKYREFLRTRVFSLGKAILCWSKQLSEDPGTLVPAMWNKATLYR